MDIHEALKFMPSLAAGTNPETVEVLDADAVYRRPIVIKALNRALSALVKQEERESFKPTNTGGYWSRRLRLEHMRKHPCRPISDQGTRGFNAPNKTVERNASR